MLPSRQLKRLMAATALAGLLPLAALADDPINGKALYTSACASCHGASPLTINSNKIYNGRNARAVIDVAISNVGDMNSLRPSFATGGSALADLAAHLGNTPTSLAFASTAVGSVSAPLSVTVYAGLKAGSALSGLSVATSGDFARAGGSCGTMLATGTSCTVLVSFAPSASGTRTGVLSLTHNNTLTPITFALSGTGTGTTQPAISLNATALNFGTQVLGNTSANQSVSVSNSGAAPLNLGSITLAGTAAGDFTRSGTCTANGTLAVGANCTLVLNFTPSVLGPRSATLTLASDASNGSAVLSLSGSGVAAAAPAVSLTPSALDFGNQTIGVISSARGVTLTNSGSAALNLSSISASTGFGVSHNCGTSLAAAGSCTLAITFTPAASGVFTGSVSIASNAAGSPHSVSLSGNGVNVVPVLVWSPATTVLDFGTAGVGGTPASQSLTLVNQGPGAVTLQQVTLAGAQAADFSLDSTSTCALNATLSQGASCSLVLRFQPAAAGARSALLQLAASGTLAPEITLTGNGTALAQANISATPTALNFTASGGIQTLTLQSTGSAGLQVTAMRIAAGTFTLAPAPTNGCPAVPFDLPPGQSCSLNVSWAATALSAETGSVEFDTNAAPAPLSVPLQAVRESATGLNGASPPGLSNVGAGGCSISRGPTLVDPTLWLLTLLAVAVLWRRRAGR